VQLLAQMEAGRQESIVEDLQPSVDDPPSKKQPQPREAANEALNTPQDRELVRKKRTPKDQHRVVDRQRDVQTGYSLRRKPRKARSKDL
jgi:hypothetical protein